MLVRVVGWEQPHQGDPTEPRRIRPLTRGGAVISLKVTRLTVNPVVLAFFL